MIEGINKIKSKIRDY